MSDDRDEVRHLSIDHMPSREDWRQVLLLAKHHKNTVGWLPDSAFSDRLRTGTLVTIWRDEVLLGYCLYDVQRSGLIKLVHVCSAERGSGIGKRLINEAVQRHPSAIGILAWCRRDWNLGPFWTGAGLMPRGERPGRAQHGSILTAWWRQLGALDLFEEAALGAGLPLVMVDTNVVSDWYASADVTRPTRRSSQALLADSVQAEITVVLSPRVNVELDGIPDPEERGRQRRAAEHHVRVRSRTADDSRTYETLRAGLRPVDIQSDPSLLNDLHHVADAIDNGVQFFVTNDERCLSLAHQFLPRDSSLEVLRPHELIRRLEQRIGFPQFQSRFIESIDLQWVPASSLPERRLIDAFVSQETRERGRAFQATLRATMASDSAGCRVLVDPFNDPWALLVQSRDDLDLRVDLFRVIRGERAATLALQLARHVRENARESGLGQIRITDGGLANVSRNALRSDGYVLAEEAYRATLIDQALPIDAILPDEPLPASVSSVREAERKFWPLVLIGAGLPAYITPIQPRFIDNLFGIERPTLWKDRSRALGLSREHVYYSGSDKSLPEEGSRILWYVTADPTGTYRAIMATSRSLGFERLDPELAFEKYGRIGVLHLRDVRNAAGRRDGKVSVIRFEDTEILMSPIKNDKLLELRQAHNVKGPIQSFRSVPPSMFDDISLVQARTGSRR
ncbi:hypothetical protein GCM10025867_08550 [Frondihabitans sucicola]|uniref:N-acetyltransferase domain-containing protein n=1 Tax=Frondihabitans sucicola TaxID=1268041 RepID=A0ABN6XUC3_9MICO|nr:GNAT family N-acetyltransferase [Frondihabitans sucicola]BDZ48614.1 hypothetical protein GCM10025867_08550 [Frondihabitans sucicola]